MEGNENVEKSPEEKTSGTGTLRQKPEISKGLKIFDFILAGISAIDFIWKISTKLSGTYQRWLDVLLPLFLAIGLLTHDKIARIFCIVLLIISILYPIIMAEWLLGLIRNY